MKITPEQMQMTLQLAAIFNPHAMEVIDSHYPLRTELKRFVHYTSAENALNIIRTKRLWMRSTMCMNDYREVDHGHDVLLRLFDSTKPWRQKFFDALGQCHENLGQDAVVAFDNTWWNLRNSIYIACLSEHLQTEDQLGRLSMWRAAASASPRVALVVSVPWFTGAALSLHLSFTPVAYFNDEQMADELMRITTRITENRDFLRTIDRNVLRAVVFGTFLSAVCALKHEGFIEEKEWRVIYCPPGIGSSELMEAEIVSIAGVPQRIYKLPIDAEKSPDLAELDLARIFDRLIIGPSQYPMTMRDAFIEELSAKGVADADRRVVFSTIPIRTIPT